MHHFLLIGASHWNTKKVQTWTDRWRAPHVLQKLSKVYSLLEDKEWDQLPGSTNAVNLLTGGTFLIAQS